MTRSALVLAVATAFTSALPGAAAAQSTDALAYTVDEEASAVDFTVSARMLFSFKRGGQFNEFSGMIAYDPDHPADTSVDLTVYTASVDTNDAEQDAMLRSEDFFAVDRYPTMHFVSAGATVRTNGSLAVEGDLTIRGITKHLVIPVRIIPAERNGRPTAAFDARFQIDRAEFGLTGRPTWNGMKVSIGRKVDIHLAIATVLTPFVVQR